MEFVSDHEYPHPFAEIVESKKRAFLLAYALTASIIEACRAVGLSESIIYTPQWRSDAVFQVATERARQMSLAVVEAEIKRRAIDGIVEPVGWFQGLPGGYVRRYSDNLLMFYAKGIAPQRYRETIEVRDGRIDWERLALMPGGQELISRIASGEDYRAVLASVVPQLAASGMLLPPGSPAPNPGQDGREEGVDENGDGQP